MCLYWEVYAKAIGKLSATELGKIKRANDMKSFRSHRVANSVTMAATHSVHSQD